MKNYKDLILQNQQFKTLWLVNLLTSFGSWFTVVATYTMLIQFDASPLIIAIVAALHWIPGAIQAPIAGIILDKVKLKNLMAIVLIVEFVITLSFLAVTKENYIWLLLVLIYIRMSSASLMFTTMQTLIPKVVDGENLRVANDITSVTWSVTFVVGMALGGIAVDSLGVSPAFILDSLLFLFALYGLKNTSFPHVVTETAEKSFQLLKDGLIYLKENKNIIYIILLHGTVGFTSFDVLVTLLAKTQYMNDVSEPLAIGVINAVRAAGLFIGPFLFIKYKESMKLLFWLMIFQGVAIIFWSVLQFDFYISLIGVFVTGVFTTSIWSITYSFIQQQTQEKFLGRVIAYNDMVFLLSNAFIAMVIGSFASYGISLSNITIFLGGLFILSALFIKNKE
ncbi:MAG: MFS transporter [Campylobacterales bacterium]|nr:MFS transporter [Campylobacterales bacterium]